MCVIVTDDVSSLREIVLFNLREIDVIRAFAADNGDGQQTIRVSDNTRTSTGDDG